MLDAPDPRASENPNPAFALKQRVLLWLLFFLICLGLGHAPLNRYDPGMMEGTADVADYRNIVLGQRDEIPPGAREGVSARIYQAQNLNRVLVPYLARPFYWLGRGHLGTWDPVLFGLLIANAIFTATTASLLVAIAFRLRLDSSTALLGATLFLLNFCVTNFNLAGMVDSAEDCFLLFIVWSLLAGRWFLLPVWGVFGALAKETFVPLSALLVLGWWVSEVRRGDFKLRHAAWMAALGSASLTTETLVMSAVTGGLVWPWQYAAFVHDTTGFLAGLRNCIFNHAFLYIFIWLLPLGLMRLRRLPGSWVMATAVAFCGALAMGAYNNAGGSTARALFNVAGPILSLSAAVFLAGFHDRAEGG